MIKLEKLTHPKFAGSKREFTQMVLPGCSDVKVGKYFRETISQKFQHYIQHLDTRNHKEVMVILEKKTCTKT